VYIFVNYELDEGPTYCINYSHLSKGGGNTYGDRETKVFLTPVKIMISEKGKNTLPEPILVGKVSFLRTYGRLNEVEVHRL
jgi:hypothetical protein